MGAQIRHCVAFHCLGRSIAARRECGAVKRDNDCLARIWMPWCHVRAERGADQIRSRHSATRRAALTVTRVYEDQTCSRLGPVLERVEISVE